MIERYHETALHRWLVDVFGLDTVGWVVLGIPAVLAMAIWWALRRASQPKDRE